MTSYQLRPHDPVAAGELGRACGLGPAAAQVLLQRGVTDEAQARTFITPKLGQLTSPASMADRAAAAERIAFAIKRRQQIAIFGDYDVDGSTSAAILSDIIEALGGSVQAFVANRFEGGYGFSDRGLQKCLAVRPQLIITCDCGSSDHARIAAATNQGIDVIVVDHHLVPKEPLPALAFLNPHRPDCGFDYKGMCSAGLALSVGAAIRAALGAKLDVRPWLDLVALGTIADVAPLNGDNRALVRAGLRLLTSKHARPGVTALREVAGLRPGSAIGAMEVAFRLAPRLNAAGRLGDPQVTLDLLRAKSLPEARRLAARIEALNSERKAIERHTTEGAIAQVREVYGDSPQHGVVVGAAGWHRGVVGITAARIVDRFDVPAVVIALDDEAGHGSARTPAGIDLHAAIQRCREHVIRFGGHAAAAGLTLAPEKLEAFRAAFASETPRPDAQQDLPLVDVELGDRYPIPSVNDLMQLEPLGQANAQPLFALPKAAVEDVRILSDGQHLKLRLRMGRTVLSAFGRDMAHRAEDLEDSVTAIGFLRPDNYRGGNHVELSAVALH